ncbi:class I SAM-dependent methyltransferase [Mesorhizobium sp. WSM4904]|uniref:class I SAM-dependent methyltransferase n=1 Tax=Mesorhizobium sp. WSM4904 TaxID=3038545 RepID=UPI0024185678|nr:class I SAM-dependent methyltransferase [Mesorhizobium sp. WSM4904]WFP61644.1 methyltransferase domain-containing protein [Mesorhizobium sp. WSM4904]
MADMQGDRHWDENHSRSFLDYGRYFVPERERQIDIIADLIPAAPDGLMVELCCGEGLLSRALLERFPDCRVLALDGSERMREQTQKTCSDHGSRLTTAAFDLADRDWRSFSEPPQAIVSSLAIHHLDGRQKRMLFADVAAALRPGGVFVVADIVRPPSAAGLAIAARQWDEAVSSRSLAIDGDLAAFAEFNRLGWNYFRNPDGEPIDKPSSLAEQLAWLAEVGFAAVDCAWLFAGHAIFSGRRPDVAGQA